MGSQDSSLICIWHKESLWACSADRACYGNILVLGELCMAAVVMITSGIQAKESDVGRQSRSCAR